MKKKTIEEWEKEVEERISSARKIIPANEMEQLRVKEYIKDNTESLEIIRRQKTSGLKYLKCV